MSSTFEQPAGELTVSAAAELACLLEATAPKLGNVHPAASFEDLQFVDFLVAAVAVGEALRASVGQPIGVRILDGVTRSGRVARSNANLGILLLIVPLAAAAESGELSRSSVGRQLQRLGSKDAEDVYAAIRAARPGGMGKAESMDVAGPAPPDLLRAMHAASSRDRIARQWVTDFQDIFETVVPTLVESASGADSILDAICRAHLSLLARWPDSLIIRKHGAEVAVEIQDEARRLKQISASKPADTATLEPSARRLSPVPIYHHEAYRVLDAQLRHRTPRINPGTTADMVAAGLFVCLIYGSLKPPTWRVSQ